MSLSIPAKSFNDASIRVSSFLSAGGCCLGIDAADGVWTMLGYGMTGFLLGAGLASVVNLYALVRVLEAAE